MNEIMVKEQQEKFFNLIEIVDNRDELKLMFQTIWKRFSTAPASRSAHGAYSGGLLDHTIIVAEKAVEISKLFNLTSPEFLNSLIKCALLHDLGKIGTLTQDRYVLDNTKQVSTYFHGFDENNYQSHESLSLWWCNHFGISLTFEEWTAIQMHSGPYVPEFQNVGNDTGKNLLIILHAADNTTVKILGV